MPRKPAKQPDHIPSPIRAAMQFLVLVEDIRNPPREIPCGRELERLEREAEDAALVLLRTYFVLQTPTEERDGTAQA